MLFSEDELPRDIESLHSLVLDLARRLQNAQHTIEAERKTAIQAQRQAEYFRTRLSESVRSFRLESARIRNTDFKTSMQIESKKYEENKVKGNTIHEELRLLELDHTMTGNRHFVPVKLQRLRSQAKQLESHQDSQKHALSQFNEQIQLQETLTTTIQQQDVANTITLLRQGADINFVDPAGYLPLHYACVYGFYDIAELLLEWGSDYTSYLSGHAPIVLAAQNGHVNIIRLLIDYGASIEETGKSGIPPLIGALTAGHFSTVEFILQQGALINSVDKAENTALHLATRLPLDTARHMCVLLLTHGANTSQVNRLAQTPEAMALYESHREIALFIRDMSQRMQQEQTLQQQQQLAMQNGDHLSYSDNAQFYFGTSNEQNVTNYVNNNDDNKNAGNNSNNMPWQNTQAAETFPANNSNGMNFLAASSASVSSSVSSPSLLHNNTSKSNTNKKPLVGLRSRLESNSTRSHNSSKPSQKQSGNGGNKSSSNNNNSENKHEKTLAIASQSASEVSAAEMLLMANGFEQPSISSSVTYDS